MSQQLSFLEQLLRERRALSVSELTAEIKILIENRFVDIWIEGEISNFKRHSSGHWYFSLKDEGATLRCASFRMQNRLVRFSPEDGLCVRARGRLSLYEARGEYQLIVESLEPVGIGALQLAFEQLQKRLAADGLFDIARKRELPALPRTVGVVTSPTGAALRDILRIIRRRNEGIHILIAPARVQGEGAAEEIAAAIEHLNEQGDAEVIIVGRGGGSIEDLWAFNEERVARAIYNSRLPVISAVGHETDFTIADFVADLRASTPSAAAEIVSMARDEVIVRLAGLVQGLLTAMRFKMLESKSALTELSSHRVFGEVLSEIRNQRQHFDDALYFLERLLKSLIRKRRLNFDQLRLRIRDANVRHRLAQHRRRFEMINVRLDAAIQKSLGAERENFAVAAGKLSSLSPLAVLGRGYAIAFDRNGHIIKRASDVGSGEGLRVRVADGEMECVRK